MTRDRIDSLTSLRFFAAAMIIVHHSRGTYLPVEFMSSFILDQGVSFFFVLSGFILTFVYPSLKGPAEIRRFLVARFARIWPAHIAAFIAILVLIGMDFFHEIKYFLIAGLNILMVHSWVPVRGVSFSFNALSWTISTEFFFYLSFPLLIRNIEKTWPWKLLFSGLLVVSLIVVSEAFRLPSDPGTTETLYSLTRTAILYVHPVARLFEFVLGMSIAVLWKRASSNWTPSVFVGTALEVLAVTAVILSLFLSTKAYLVNPVSPAAAEYLVHTASSLAFAVLIFVCSFESGLVSNALKARPLVLLGEISYSIYLFHQILVQYLTHYSKDFRLLYFIPDHLQYPAFLAILFIVSYVSWRFVEAPCRSFIKSAGIGRPSPRLKPAESE